MRARTRRKANCRGEAEAAAHPKVVCIGARRLRRFTVAPSTALAEFQPRRLVHAEAAWRRMALRQDL